MGKKPKRTLKDSVFVALFKIKKNALTLYRSFHPEDRTITESECEILTLQTVLVGGIYNDFGMLVRDKIMVLMEAQSTFSENLAARILLYYTETVSRYMENHGMNPYSTKKLKLPRPDFYMVYIGPKKNVPDTIYYSDLYGDDEDHDAYTRAHGGINLAVKVIRKTGDGGILDQYVRFCEISYAMQEKYGHTMEAIRATIDRCLEEGILVEFLTSRREEVQEAMMDLYNEEVISRNYEHEIRQDAHKKGREQGREEGREEGELSGIEKGIQAMVEVLKSVSLSKESITNTIAAKFGLQPQIAAEKVARYW